jgi:hemolysin activation/secretion protein
MVAIRRPRSHLTLSVALLLPAFLAAQQVPDAGQALRESRPPRREVESRPPPELPAEPPPTPLAGQGRVQVKSFRITGNTLVPTEELSALVGNLAGRELHFADLQAAAAQLTARYRQYGYLLARAYLPPQEVVDGTIEIAVVEGRIDSIAVATPAGVRLKTPLVEKLFAPTVARGAAIRDLDLERGLLLLNELPGIASAAILQPGAAVGTSQLVLRLEEASAVGGGIEIDNYGSRYTGEWRLGATGRLTDRFGRGEQFTLRGLTTSTGGIKSGGLSIQLPLPSLAWTLHADLNTLRYRLGGEFAALAARGTATDALLGLDWAWVRTRAWRATVGAQVIYRDLSDVLGSAGTENDRRLTSAVLRLAVSRSDGWLGGGIWGFQTSLTAGDLSLDTPAQEAFDQSPAGRHTAGGFTHFNTALWREQSLFGRWSLLGVVSGQLASDNLDTSEKVSLGGPNAIRAYPVSEAAADEELMGRVELRYAVGHFPRLGAATLFVFGDAGAARINRRPLAIDEDNHRRLHGYGVGANLAKAGRYEVNATAAWRGASRSVQDPDAGSLRVFVAATRQF